jgi:hypothetical protein
VKRLFYFAHETPFLLTDLVIRFSRLSCFLLLWKRGRLLHCVEKIHKVEVEAVVPPPVFHVLDAQHGSRLTDLITCLNPKGCGNHFELAVLGKHQPYGEKSLKTSFLVSEKECLASEMCVAIRVGAAGGT